MSIEDTIAAIKGLPGVRSAVELEAGKITILAVAPVPYEDIDLAAGACAVEICVLEEHATTEFVRFHGEHLHHEYRDRTGAVIRAGEGGRLQAEMGLSAPPRTNVLIGENVGLLFGDLRDLLRYRDRR